MPILFNVFFLILKSFCIIFLIVSFQISEKEDSFSQFFYFDFGFSFEKVTIKSLFVFSRFY